MDDSNKQQPEQSKSWRHKKKHSSKKRWLIVIAVAILVIGGGVGVWLYISFSSKKPVSTPVTVSTPLIIKDADQVQVQQVASSADTQANSGDVSGAKATYDTAIQQTSDAAQKSYFLIGEASLYYDDGNYDQALVIAKQAESFNLDENAASIIAEIYRMKGDKPNAILYYEKSKLLTNKSDPANDRTQFYQNEINILNGVDN